MIVSILILLEVTLEDGEIWPFNRIRHFIYVSILILLEVTLEAKWIRVLFGQPSICFNPYSIGSYFGRQLEVCFTYFFERGADTLGFNPYSIGSYFGS